MSNYENYTTDELLQALETGGRTPPLALIQASLNRQAEITPGLLTLFAEGLHDDWEDPEDPRWYRAIHAAQLLLAFREEVALPLFAELYLEDSDDSLAEWFETAPADYGPVAVPTFAEVMRTDTGPDWHYGRALSTGILRLIALRHPETRDEIVAILSSVLPPLKEDGSIDWPEGEPIDENWTNVVSELTDLRDEASRPHIEALFDADFIDEMMISKEEYLEAFQPNARPPDIDEPRDILNEYEFLHERSEMERQQQAQAEQERALKLAQRLSTPPPTIAPSKQAAAPAVQKVGRNEPCPCGSGQKYKKCHGRPGQS